jgi:TIR domain
MPNAAQMFRFEVAFSFAGPHHEKVRDIAELVATKLGRERVFFDEWYEHEILGDDMDALLQRFYLQESLFVLADLSDDYAGRPWCQAEARAIRALRFEIDPARNETQRLRLLNVRFGPGEVPGIFKTTAYLDGMNKTAQQCADLILKRLDLLRERLAPGSPPDVASSPPTAPWPETPALLSWPMADHSAARKAFAELLTSKALFRFLPICGPSETGKSHITRQMLGNVLAIPDIACGRFDFKGTTDMDNEIKAFIQELGVSEPGPNVRLNERLSEILIALKRRARPTLLIFDTYEMAGEAEDWVEKQLLPCLIRATWLRVVIAGQKVPGSNRAIWATVAHSIIDLVTPPPADWLEYARQSRPNLTLSEVETVYRITCRSSVLDQVFGPAR